MSAAEYVILSSRPTANAFELHYLSSPEHERYPDTYEIVEGESCLAHFPKGATHSIRSENKKKSNLDDVFHSPMLIVLISERLQKFLKKKSLKNVEFLPVNLLDHDKKPVAPYFIFSPIHPIDCLDEVASGAKKSLADKDYVNVKEIVLKADKIDPGLLAFRIKKLFNLVIIRRDLAMEMKAQNFTGFDIKELQDFNNY